MSEAHTLYCPPCENHPPFSEWPTWNLIQGQCPSCLCFVAESWRELAARRLIRGVELEA